MIRIVNDAEGWSIEIPLAIESDGGIPPEVEAKGRTAMEAYIAKRMQELTAPPVAAPVAAPTPTPAPTASTSARRSQPPANPEE